MGRCLAWHTPCRWEPTATLALYFLPTGASSAIAPYGSQVGWPTGVVANRQLPPRAQSPPPYAHDRAPGIRARVRPLLIT